MKYIAIIRYSFLTGEWTSGPTSFVHKSDFFDNKKTASEWIKSKLQEIGKNYEGRHGQLVIHETILAINLEDSENYENFFNLTLN